jgi:hypothetical protein
MKLAEYYRHIGRVRRRLLQVKTYPRWKPIGANKFIYYLSADFHSWVEEVQKLSDGSWMAGQTYNDTAHRFDDLEDALKYGEALAFPKVQAHKFHQAEKRRKAQRAGVR